MHDAMEGKRPLSPFKGMEIWPRWHGHGDVECMMKPKEPEKKARGKEPEKIQLPQIKTPPAKNRNLPR